MIKRIKKLINEILMSSHAILFNPTEREVLKEFRRASFLRFVVDLKDNYYIADASEYVHYQIIREMKIHKEDSSDVIEGFLYIKGGEYGDFYFRLFSQLLEDMAIHYRVATEKDFEDNILNSGFYQEVEDKVVDEFKQSSIYKNLGNKFNRIIIK